MDFPQQSHLFSIYKPKKLSKSTIFNDKRDYESDFFELLEKIKLNSPEKDKIYQEIFILLGEFKLFCEEIARNFIENIIESDELRYLDFEQIEEDLLLKNIKTFSSQSLNLSIKCVISSQNPEILSEFDEDFIKDFKYLSSLFLGYEHLLNGILAILPIKTQNFRVPLAHLITYKGNKLLFLTENPIISSEKALIQGFSQGNYRISSKFFEDISPLSEVLCIEPKEILFGNSDFPIAVWISSELKVFQKDFLSENSYYYMKNPINMLPNDANYHEKPYAELRYEIKDFFLSVDFSNSQQIKEISNEIERNIIEKVIFQLESLKEIPLNSENFAEIFHKNGINMRYLGFFYRKTQQIYLKELISNEIITRTCKKIFMNHLLSLKNLENKEEIAIDFLNVIFGFGPETEAFWLEIFSKETKKNFMLNLQISRQDINENLLLKIISSLLLDIKAEKTMNFPLKQEIPFKISDFNGFRMKSKGFSLKAFNFIEKDLKNSDTGSTKDLILCFNANLSLFSMQKSLGNLLKAEEYGLNLCELYLRNKNYEQARISLIKIMKISSIHHISTLIRGNFLLFRCFIGLFDDEFLTIFANLLEILGKNYGSFHPFHILIYEELAIFYQFSHKFDDANFLVKNAIVCALKILGSKHWIIIDLYTLLGKIYLQQEQKENALFYWQKAYEIKRKKGLGIKIAELLLSMNQILEAKEFFLNVLRKKTEEKRDFFEENEKITVFKEEINEKFDEKLNKQFDEENEEKFDLEALLNLSLISLILNEGFEAEKWLRLAFETRKSEDFIEEYEGKFIKMGFFWSVRQLQERNKTYLWIISKSLVEFGLNFEENPLEIVKEEMRKHWNLLDFLKYFFEELTFICEKNEYINDGEYWRLYLKNISLKDPHNVKKSLRFLNALMKIIGEKLFIEELLLR